MITVSVIIVTRNEERFIRDCIKSIEAQFLDQSTKWELIVIDGMSTDRTKDIALECTTTAPYPFRLINNPSLTLATGWNIGISAAHGEFIVRPDAHSALQPGYILQGIKRLQELDDVVAVGGCLETKSKTSGGQVFAYALSSRAGVGNSSFRTLQRSSYSDTAVFAVYRRSVLVQIGGLNEKLIRHQDNELHERLSRIGWKFFQDEQMKAIYYCRDTLHSVIHQMYYIGYYLPDLWLGDYPHRGGIHLRNLAPLAFLLLLSGFGIIGIATHQPWIQLLLPCIYISILFADSLIGYFKTKSYARLFTCIAIPFMHLAYGVGTAVGFIHSLWSVLIRKVPHV